MPPFYESVAVRREPQSVFEWDRRAFRMARAWVGSPIQAGGRTSSMSTLVGIFIIAVIIYIIIKVIKFY